MKKLFRRLAQSTEELLAKENILDSNLLTIKLVLFRFWYIHIPLLLVALVGVISCDGLFEDLCAVLALPLVLFWLLVRAIVQKVFMRRFAQSKNLRFVGDVDENLLGDALPFQGAIHRRFYNVMEGDFLGYLARIANLDVTVYKRSLYAKEKMITFSLTMIQVQFAGSLPRMFLDAHREKEGHGKRPSRLLQGLDRVRLESNDFNRRYAVWITPGKAAWALQVLNPIVLEDLTKARVAHDIEIVDDHLYLYTDGIVSQQWKMDETLAIAGQFLNRLGNELEGGLIGRSERASFRSYTPPKFFKPWWEKLTRWYVAIGLIALTLFLAGLLIYAAM